MKSQIFVLLSTFIFFLPCFCTQIFSSGVNTSFNVVDYGALGNGQTDDSQAFLKAWQQVCGATQGTPTLIVPRGKTFMLQPVMFMGPCKAAIVNFNLQGIITAPNTLESWKWGNSNKDSWITFSNINGLVVNGGGQIDGQGAPWWQCKNCDRPTVLKFNDCQNLKLSRLAHINSPRNHISINLCNNATISDLHIEAPKESPNTDGIDIASSSNLVITTSTIQTGDDCIAINNGSSYINITSIVCGPGHGISIGSLGRNGAYETVEMVHVQNCTFNGSSNGARIKTWKGGSGYARNITFENITIVGGNNPIIIDQQYDNPYYTTDDGIGTAVKVSDVTYRNVLGTTAWKDAIQLNCDPIGCNDIVLDNINITSTYYGQANQALSTCQYAQGTCTSCNPHVSCLSGFL
ncbi:probable polygalacturonase At3g15720 [Arachis hypogaea]|uniref:probable polygalacturonase At3g15720 n=1 Tax=Arachis hypogaea TaxID=3818 RepID=UPI000DECC1BD|nr:probable polygalacturonase At3g15720 [Arachis hypogaea]